MRLSNANAKKLSGLVWRERLRKVAIVGAVAAALIGLVVWFTNYRLERADPTLAVTPVEATVTKKDTTRVGRSGFVFHAQLGDGREVDAVAPSGFPPAMGVHVVLGEARHKSGRLSYDLIRTVE